MFSRSARTPRACGRRSTARLPQRRAGRTIQRCCARLLAARSREYPASNPAQRVVVICLFQRDRRPLIVPHFVETPLALASTTVRKSTARLPARAGSRATRAGTLATRAGSLATRAGTLATRAGTLATRAGRLATRAGSLATRAGSLATRAGSLATRGGSLATRGGSLATRVPTHPTVERVCSTVAANSGRVGGTDTHVATLLSTSLLVHRFNRPGIQWRMANGE
jgi:hypothetical protein